MYVCFKGIGILFVCICIGCRSDIRCAHATLFSFSFSLSFSFCLSAASVSHNLSLCREINQTVRRRNWLKVHLGRSSHFFPPKFPLPPTVNKPSVTGGQCYKNVKGPCHHKLGGWGNATQNSEKAYSTVNTRGYGFYERKLVDAIV
jgi:hypothetical protein